MNGFDTGLTPMGPDNSIHFEIRILKIYQVPDDDQPVVEAEVVVGEESRIVAMRPGGILQMDFLPSYLQN